MIERQHGVTRALRTHNLKCGWEWKQRDNSASELKDLEVHDGWTATSVPTEIFKDLLEAGRIPDPHLDQNEKKVQWVGEVDWMYRTKFTVDCTSDDKVVLVFDGLDTFATVYLNGTQILKSEVFYLH